VLAHHHGRLPKKRRRSFRLKAKRSAYWRCCRAWQERSGANDRELAPRFAAGRTIALYRRWHADRIVAEKNFGGDMVEAKIRAVDSSVSFRAVAGSCGKLVRAEPCAVLFEQDRMKLAGIFPQSEEGAAPIVARAPCRGRGAFRLHQGFGIAKIRQKWHSRTLGHRGGRFNKEFGKWVALVLTSSWESFSWLS
jgi:hypothetical protein